MAVECSFPVLFGGLCHMASYFCYDGGSECYVGNEVPIPTDESVSNGKPFCGRELFEGIALCGQDLFESIALALSNMTMGFCKLHVHYINVKP